MIYIYVWMYIRFKFHRLLITVSITFFTLLLANLYKTNATFVRNECKFLKITNSPLAKENLIT